MVKEGTFDDLAVVRDLDAPGSLLAGQVRVGVRAAGVNFRDVLVVLGMYPGGGSVGGEGAGVVLEVGPGVEGLAVGDRVMGLMVGAFGSVAITDERLLVQVPEGWSFTRAASVPIAFLTAYYALTELAKVRKGERLLVHAAAGGVGIAAVQLALHMGLEVFATASEAKWGTLAALGLDEEHVASSRTLQFGEQFAERGGVDVVLNSLANEFVDVSLGLLGESGRFLEMGKTDIRDAAQVNESFSGVSYQAFDLIEAGPERIQVMLRELVGLLEGGQLQGLPVRVWDMEHMGEALRFMSQARHIGKNVLRLPVPAFDGQGTVLITGGTGGLGALLARHLVQERGVRNLLLVSRGGPDVEGVCELVSHLEGVGASVRVEACDVADREQVKLLVEGIDPERPLIGVVHAAGVLDDGLMESIAQERMEEVMAPKVAGAWHLHEITKELDLRAFVLFSSIAGVIGSAGQSAYAAGNAFLDALASSRRSQGLSGSSLAWGPWGQVGMAQLLDEDHQRRIARSGLRALPSEEGLGLFDAAMQLDRALLLPVALDMKSLRTFAQGGLLPALFDDVVRVPIRSRQSVGQGGESLAARLVGLGSSERERVMVDLVCQHAAAVLGHSSAERIDPELLVQRPRVRLPRGGRAAQSVGSDGRC